MRVKANLAEVFSEDPSGDAVPVKDHEDVSIVIDVFHDASPTSLQVEILQATGIERYPDRKGHPDPNLQTTAPTPSVARGFVTTFRIHQ